MPLKAPKARPRVGAERPPGDVRPVSTRTLVLIGLAIVVVVAGAISALVASSASPRRATSTSNVPRSVSSSGSPQSLNSTYRETVQFPAGSAQPSVVAATLRLSCQQVCTGGQLRGYGGTFILTVIYADSPQLTGTLTTACQTGRLMLSTPDPLNPLPQILTGTLTRTTTCAGTSVPSQVTIRLDRT